MIRLVGADDEQIFGNIRLPLAIQIRDTSSENCMALFARKTNLVGFISAKVNYKHQKCLQCSHFTSSALNFTRYETENNLP